MNRKITADDVRGCAEDFLSTAFPTTLEDWTTAKTLSQICDSGEVEVVTTQAAKDRTPLELLDAELFLVQVGDSATRGVCVKFNASKESGFWFFDDWLELHRNELESQPLLLATYRLKEPAAEFADFQWMLDSVAPIHPF